MEHFKIKYNLVKLGIFLIYFNFSYGKEDFIRIPVSISPLLQLPFIEISRTAQYFYGMDKHFYSKVTALDVAKNEDNHISKTIKKPIGVVFLIAASSHVSGTLTRKNLAYLDKSSKWSYKIPVKQLLSESKESSLKLTDRIQIYKIQELAMKVLAKQYGFSLNFILHKHHITPMELYGANEEEWKNIVGTITDIVIKKRSEQFKLTPCYLAELVNKTQDEMQGFTLDEVDMYLKNVSALKEKLTAYQNETLRSLYETLNITPTQLAKMSSLNIRMIETMGIRDTTLLLTKTVMLKLNIREEHSGFSNREAICRSQWTLFRHAAVTEAFEKQAKEMSVTPTTLGAISQVPYNTINKVSIKKMIHYIEAVINPIKQDKRKIEKFTLSTLRNSYSSKRLNTGKHNAISLIKRTTKFRKRNLKLLYGWTSRDYHFARLFSVDDLGKECSFDVEKKTLLSLANVNIGQVSKDINCTAFYALKLVWGRASLNDVQKLYNSKTRISLDVPIASIVSKLTHTSLRISCRVLTKTPIIQWLLQRITLNNISEMTNHTDIYLQEISIQRIMLMIHELFNAGSFSRLIQVFKLINYSPGMSTFNYTDEMFTDAKLIGYGDPKAHPRSASKQHMPDPAILTFLLIAALLNSSGTS